MEAVLYYLWLNVKMFSDPLPLILFLRPLDHTCHAVNYYVLILTLHKKRKEGFYATYEKIIGSHTL